MELNLAAAQAELDAAKLEVASRDQTSAESKSQAEAAAARLQVPRAKRAYGRDLTLLVQTLEQQLQGAQDALQKKDLEVQVCKVEFDARNAEERLRFASEIKARNEELLALRVDRDDCVRQWAAEKSSMQEEIKV